MGYKSWGRKETKLKFSEVPHMKLEKMVQRWMSSLVDYRLLVRKGKKLKWRFFLEGAAGGAC